KVALSWAAATGATNYQLYRNTINDSASASLLSQSVTTTFDDTTASPNATYYYWVASINSASVTGAKSAVDSGFADSIAPTVTGHSFQGQFGPPYISFSFSEALLTPIDIADL